MTLIWNDVIIVLKWPIFFNFRKSLLPFGTTASVLPGSAGVDWGAGGNYHETLRSPLVGWTPKKANSVLPQRLEEKKKAQAEKDQLEPTSASVSLPIPDDRAADQDAHADVSPEVENQPDTGQAVRSGEWRISGSWILKKDHLNWNKISLDEVYNMEVVF